MKIQKILTIGLALAVILQINIMVDEAKADETPTISFVKAEFANTLTVTSVEPSDILWSDIEISGWCNTSWLETYVTAGDTIFGCYGVITLTYLPNNTLIGSWTFSSYPEITFAMNDNTNTITLTSVAVPDVFWEDIEVIGECDTSGLSSYIEPGDQITDCYGTITLTFIPEDISSLTML